MRHAVLGVGGVGGFVGAVLAHGGEQVTLLLRPDCAAELDLLHERLQHGAIAFEELEVAPTRVRA